MLYGGPCYVKNNIVETGFASQKHFIGIYILKQDVMKKYKDELKDANIGKGVIRYTNPDKIDLDVIKKMLTGTYELVDSICGHKNGT